MDRTCAFKLVKEWIHILNVGIFASQVFLFCMLMREWDFFYQIRFFHLSIDATEESGRLGRLINHSKTAGNCHTKLTEINNKPYLMLIASRDIVIGEELLYDYGDRNKDSLESHPWLKS